MWKASQGFPGTATILPVLLHEGYHRGHLSLGRIASALCAAPASICNLPQKRVLEPGRDADLTLVDLQQVRRVEPEQLRSFSDYSLYEGQSPPGRPATAILRGQVIMDQGRVTRGGGYGQYLRR